MARCTPAARRTPMCTTSRWWTSCSTSWPRASRSARAATRGSSTWASDAATPRRWCRSSWCSRAGGGVRTLRLLLAYDGTAYQGFGIQPRAPTIQGTLEPALGAALDGPVRVIAGGRTDSGGHAAGQVVSLQTTSRLAPDAIRRATNAGLPEDILVRAVGEAPEGFDARRCASWRRYRYTLWRERDPNLWWRRYTTHWPGPLDLAAMRR